MVENEIKMLLYLADYFMDDTVQCAVKVYKSSLIWMTTCFYSTFPHLPMQGKIVPFLRSNITEDCIVTE